MSSYTNSNTYFIDNPGSMLSSFILRMYHFMFGNVKNDIFLKYTMKFVYNEELIYFLMSQNNDATYLWQLNGASPRNRVFSI